MALALGSLAEVVDLLFEMEVLLPQLVQLIQNDLHVLVAFLLSGPYVILAFSMELVFLVLFIINLVVLDLADQTSLHVLQHEVVVPAVSRVQHVCLPLGRGTFLLEPADISL